MNRAEKYTTLLVFLIVTGSIITLSSLIYMNTYHVVEQREDFVVWQSNGIYGADQIVRLIDTYPYLDKQIILDRYVAASFTDKDWLPVVCWALDSSDDRSVYLQSNAIPLDMSGKVTFPSGTYILGDVP